MLDPFLFELCRLLGCLGALSLVLDVRPWPSVSQNLSENVSDKLVRRPYSVNFNIMRKSLRPHEYPVAQTLASVHAAAHAAI